MPDYLIVIPVHNAAEISVECIQSLVASGHELADILVVDNGSSISTRDRLREAFPDINVAERDNQGYGASANFGIAESLRRKRKYTWILNSDTIVNAKAADTLSAFMNREENTSVGACSPLIFHAHDPAQVDFAGGILSRKDWAVVHVDDPARGADILVRDPRASFLTGCALFVRNQAAVDVDYFDERFFMYWEDCDFSIRLVDHGWSLRLVPDARILHKSHGSAGGGMDRTPFSIYYEVRNAFLMWRKHSRGPISRSSTLVRMTVWIVEMFIDRHYSHMPETKRAAAEGFVDGVKGRFGPKKRSLPDTQVRAITSLLWSCALPYRLVSGRKRS